MDKDNILKLKLMGMIEGKERENLNTHSKDLIFGNEVDPTTTQYRYL